MTGVRDFTTRNSGKERGKKLPPPAQHTVPFQRERVAGHNAFTKRTPGRRKEGYFVRKKKSKAGARNGNKVRQKRKGGRDQGYRNRVLMNSCSQQVPRTTTSVDERELKAAKGKKRVDATR